jgi:hypothetical protein
MNRAAVVIGVNKTTGLPELTGAASDAVRFADWLTNQGYVTTKFVDRLDDGTAKSVTFNEIFAEVKRIVEAQTFSQLAIYFAGHGFQSNGSEVWLLSGAPDNAREAIGLEASVLAARESGLNSVVFVSDACRSIPGTLQDSRIDGGSIFPNRPLARATRPDVDRFFATLPSLVAVAAANANDAARRNGVFTREFRRAYRNPADKFVAKITEKGVSVEVVTNRSLKKLLQISVEDAVHEVAPKAGQLPDAIVESDDAYVGRVVRTRLFGAAEGAEHSLQAPAMSVAEAVRNVIDAAPGHGAAAQVSAESQSIDAQIGLSLAIDRLAGPVLVDHFESETGFSVADATISNAWSTKFRIELRDGRSVVLWDDHNHRVGTVLIQFSNGSGTLVPGLRGYIGHIVVDRGAIANVNFLPSTNSQRWLNFGARLQELDRLRASVAAASGLGMFRVPTKDAGQFADTIRELKGADPSLGLYAAYAYSSVGLANQVESVRDYMRRDLGVDLFDVAMLSRRGVSASDEVVPICPMLRQGWSLTGVTEAKLSPLMEEARKSLLPGLWTTFAPDGMALLIDAANKGELR